MDDFVRKGLRKKGFTVAYDESVVAFETSQQELEGAIRRSTVPKPPTSQERDRGIQDVTQFLIGEGVDDETARMRAQAFWAPENDPYRAEQVARGEI